MAETKLYGDVQVNSNILVFDTAKGFINPNGVLSMIIKVEGGGVATTFVLFNGWTISDTDAPISFPFYDSLNSRRYDNIPFTRTIGTGKLVVLIDVGQNCR